MFPEELPLSGNQYNRTFHSPTMYWDSKASMRCGRDNMAHGPNTEMLDVQAGDTFEIAHSRADNPWDPVNYDCPDDLGTCWFYSGKPERKYPNVFIHDGPVFVHLSKVPEGQGVRQYDGSGEWVKIFTLGLEMRHEQFPDYPVHWKARNSPDPRDLIAASPPPRIKFTIPTQTPPGDYLMRMDQIWLRYFGSNDTQFYNSCAHLRVKSNSTAQLPPGILIPEDLSPKSPGKSFCAQLSDLY
jgi:hypothetical protein